MFDWSQTARCSIEVIVLESDAVSMRKFFSFRLFYCFILSHFFFFFFFGLLWFVCFFLLLHIKRYNWAIAHFQKLHASCALSQCFILFVSLVHDLFLFRAKICCSLARVRVRGKSNKMMTNWINIQRTKQMNSVEYCFDVRISMYVYFTFSGFFSVFSWLFHFVI